MSADDTKAAPSLADEFVRAVDMSDMAGVLSLTAWCRSNRDAVAAALRAVEAVRAFSADPPREPDESCKTDPCGYCDGYRDGVEAVQALLEGESGETY